ncbi:unnamed protein product [marine sediment metagenome]|uniref:Uncharacterized protein n=1 Tax=marine sediment metagenome TaxID=412755 RepID=X1TVV4_9ZZZZ
MEQFISLMLKDAVIKDLQKLSQKLDLSRSGTVRLAIEQLIEQYSGPEADLVVLDRGKFDAIIKGLSRQLGEEVRDEITEKVIEQVQKDPEIQRLLRAAEKGQLEIEK